MSRIPDQGLVPGLVLAVAGSIAFSGKAIIVKLAYRYGVDAVTLIMYRKSFGRQQLAGMAVSYCGVILVLGREVRFEGGQAALGALLVFASAVTYAIYLVYSGQLVRRLGSLRLVGLATSVACLCCLLQFVLLRPLDTALAVAPEVIWLSLLNATLCTAAPVLMVMMAIERIGPALAAQTGMVGPMSTILMGVLILGEPFTAWIAAGTLLVLAGIFMFTRAPR